MRFLAIAWTGRQRKCKSVFFSFAREFCFDDPFFIKPFREKPLE